MGREFSMTDAIAADLLRAQKMHQIISDTLAGNYDADTRSALSQGLCRSLSAIMRLFFLC